MEAVETFSLGMAGDKEETLRADKFNKIPSLIFALEFIKMGK